NKLVRRHPHVFGDVKADDANQVLENWEALKAQERKEKKDKQGENNHLAATESRHEPLLSGVSAKMPALMEAQKISSKAAHVGFDWQSIDGLFEKLAEETEELRENLRAAPAEALESKNSAKLHQRLRARFEDEVGDLFFVLVNIARHLSVDPESALRRTNRKFKRRFQWMEEQLRASGRSPEQSSMEELESLWQQAKRQEREKQ